MRKFKIPDTPQTSSKSIRFPNHLIEQIEGELIGSTCSFSSFVIEAVRVALADLEEMRNDQTTERK